MNISYILELSLQERNYLKLYKKFRILVGFGERAKRIAMFMKTSFNLLNITCN